MKLHRMATILRQSLDFRTTYVDLKTNLRHYDNRTNTPNIVNITKYINVNIKTSLFTSSHEITGKYVIIENLTDNDIIQTRRF